MSGSFFLRVVVAAMSFGLRPVESMESIGLGGGA